MIIAELRFLMLPDSDRMLTLCMGLRLRLRGRNYGTRFGDHQEVTVSLVGCVLGDSDDCVFISFLPEHPLGELSALPEREPIHNDRLSRVREVTHVRLD
jgi:hypothetical protein